jgi:ABC-type transporter Mla subunit MlaD
MRDFRNATTASFNAQRQDFVDLRQDFVDLTNQVDRGFTEMRGKFDGTAAGLQQITQLLQAIAKDGPER